MKTTVSTHRKSIIAALMLTTLTVGSAWADRGYGGHHHGRHGDHFRSRIFLGIGVGPYWGPWYSPAPYSYYPYYPQQVIVEPPPVYIEQAEQQPAANNFWYYCRQSKRYYPEVSECPVGWQLVSPTPPDAR